MANEAFLVKFYMEELSEVIDAADSVLLVRPAVEKRCQGVELERLPDYY